VNNHPGLPDEIAKAVVFHEKDGKEHEMPAHYEINFVIFHLMMTISFNSGVALDLD